MAEIDPALRAYLDRELTAAVDGLLRMAAELDGQDIIEANVDLTNHLLATISMPALAAASAALALRLHRTRVGGGDRV